MKMSKGWMAGFVAIIVAAWLGGCCLVYVEPHGTHPCKELPAAIGEAK
jgi:hypothetical protein